MADNRLVNDQSVQNGVLALGTAKDGVNRIRTNVQALSLGVNGDEGRAFQALFRAWDEQAQKIINQIEKMANALEDNRQQARQTSRRHQESIAAQTNQVSAGVFDAPAQFSPRLYEAAEPVLPQTSPEPAGYQERRYEAAEPVSPQTSPEPASYQERRYEAAEPASPQTSPEPASYQLRSAVLPSVSAGVFDALT